MVIPGDGMCEGITVGALDCPQPILLQDVFRYLCIVLFLFYVARRYRIHKVFVNN